MRQFCDRAAAEVGISLRWEGEGVNEHGIVKDVRGYKAKSRVGDVIVRVDPRYFRPTEVETLLGDPTKAHRKLGWTPATSFETLVSEMMESDYESARRDDLVRRHGFTAFDRHE